MKATLNPLPHPSRPFEPVEITILLKTEVDVISLYHRINLSSCSIIGAYGDERDRFPNLDKVADEEGKYQVWKMLQKIVEDQNIKL